MLKKQQMRLLKNNLNKYIDKNEGRLGQKSKTIELNYRRAMGFRKRRQH